MQETVDRIIMRRLKLPPSRAGARSMRIRQAQRPRPTGAWSGIRQSRSCSRDSRQAITRSWSEAAPKRRRTCSPRTTCGSPVSSRTTGPVPASKPGWPRSRSPGISKPSSPCWETGSLPSMRRCTSWSSTPRRLAGLPSPRRVSLTARLQDVTGPGGACTSLCPGVAKGAPRPASAPG